LGTAALGGCGTYWQIVGEPTETNVPAEVSVRPDQEAVGVCYNGNNTTREDLVAAARGLCKEPGSNVQFRTEDLHFNECPLLKKRRAIFVCTDPK
jgi:hypothetical protein